MSDQAGSKKRFSGETLSNVISRRQLKATHSVATVVLLLLTMKPVAAWVGSNPRYWNHLVGRQFGSRVERAIATRKWSMATDSRELRFMGGALLQDMPSRVASSFSTVQPVSRVASAAVVGLENMVFSARKDTATLHQPNVFSIRQISTNATHQELPQRPREGYGPSIQLTDEECRLFNLLREVRDNTGLSTTLRVAGGWVRDKLLATKEFRTYHKIFDVGAQRLTSKFQRTAPSLGRQGTKVLVSSTEDENLPVDIDIALDDMLGREFADHLNEYLTSHGEDAISVGVVLKNPERSKHLETATLKVESFWIDFVNLRAEEYTQDSRIPDLMRIGTPAEDSLRRDLTINSLFYNVNTGQVEDWTGRGFDDLRKGIVATPLAPLTTLLDDPLRVLRSVRFAARLRFQMDSELVAAAMDQRVRTALAQKVSRERIGGEVDLMLRSPDPVGAMRLLVNLRLAETVFPINKYLEDPTASGGFLLKCLDILSISHDHLADCRLSPPLWCLNKNPIYNGGGPNMMRLVDDDEGRRLLWYASFLKPLWDEWKRQDILCTTSKRSCKKANRSIVSKLLVDDLKRPTRDAEAVEKIIKASNEFTQLVNSGCDISATMILLSDVRITAAAQISEDPDEEEYDGPFEVLCSMGNRIVDSTNEEDPLWTHAMELRQLCSKVLQRVGPLWRASLVLSISEQLASVETDGLEYAIEGDVVEESQDEVRQGIIEQYDAFAAALQQLGLIGIWKEKPLLDGGSIKQILPRIPRGPAFRDVMEEQTDWMVSHPGAPSAALRSHLISVFPEFAPNAVET